jgi:hypothetical protein
MDLDRTQFLDHCFVVLIVAVFAYLFISLFSFAWLHQPLLPPGFPQPRRTKAGDHLEGLAASTYGSSLRKSISRLRRPFVSMSLLARATLKQRFC